MCRVRHPSCELRVDIRSNGCRPYPLGACALCDEISGQLEIALLRYQIADRMPIAS